MSNHTLLITLAQPKPDEMATFHGYVGASTELALEAGGEVLFRFGVRHIHGNAPAVIFGFATFPSADTITDMFNSDAYQALVPAREQSIECVNAYIVDETPVTSVRALGGGLRWGGIGHCLRWCNRLVADQGWVPTVVGMR